MTNHSTPILLLGESDVGKTHYGAQLLRRLNLQSSELKIQGAAENIEPFEEALSQISNGLSAAHTPQKTYADSVWPVASDTAGVVGDLIWPDYGGEQIKQLIDSKKLPTAWRERTIQSKGWVVMIRPTRTTLPDDIVTRARAVPADHDDKGSEMEGLSRQTRVIELLQILMHTYTSHHGSVSYPPIVLLLTCFDELDNVSSPVKYLENHLPLINDFLSSNWPQRDLLIYGLSSLGQALDTHQADEKYSQKGPENCGFIVENTGEKKEDLTIPLLRLMNLVNG